MWVGGIDNGLGGGWKWLDGEPVDTAEWGKKQPNVRRATEKCLVMRRDRHPALYDEPCGSNLRFVCQYQGDSLDYE